MQGQRCIQMNSSELNNQQTIEQNSQEEKAKEEDGPGRLSRSKAILDDPDTVLAVG